VAGLGAAALGPLALAGIGAAAGAGLGAMAWRYSGRGAKPTPKAVTTAMTQGVSRAVDAALAPATAPPDDAYADAETEPARFDPTNLTPESMRVAKAAAAQATSLLLEWAQDGS
jgi:hypothetical protein